MTYTIKHVSQKMDIPTDTLRYYEKMGLVTPSRSENGYRSYTEADVKTLQYISVLKYAQFSLQDIKSIVETLELNPSDACKRNTFDLFAAKKSELEVKVSVYNELIKSLEMMTNLIGNASSYLEIEEQVYSATHALYTQIKGE